MRRLFLTFHSSTLAAPRPFPDIGTLPTIVWSLPGLGCVTYIVDTCSSPQQKEEVLRILREGSLPVLLVLDCRSLTMLAGVRVQMFTYNNYSGIV